MLFFIVQKIGPQLIYTLDSRFHIKLAVPFDDVFVPKNPLLWFFDTLRLILFFGLLSGHVRTNELASAAGLRACSMSFEGLFLHQKQCLKKA